MSKRHKIGVGLVVAAGLAAGVAYAQPGTIVKQIMQEGEVSVSAFVEEAEARAREIDTDGNGIVTEAELRAHRDARRTEREARRFPDADGDGVVSLSEYEQQARDRFAKLDANSDGVLTTEEMPAKRERRGRRHRNR